jgi:hypothetical protein
VVERALDELPATDAEDLVRRLTRAMAGRGLVVVLPQQLTGAAELFDEVVTFEAGMASASAGEPIVQSSVPHLAEPRGGADLKPEPAWSSR